MTSHSTGNLKETNLRVLIADEDESALRGLHEVLEQLGHEVTPYAVSVAEAVDLIARESPQVAIVVVHEDDEHALALIAEAVEFADGPVVAQLPDADIDFLSRAAEAGISAFAESSDPESIQGTIEVAVRRYRENRELVEKVGQLEGALERRAVIERAKGILMERHSVDEQRAFELLRDHSRGSGRRVIDVARSVVDGHALLPRRP
ncbi:MAG TPA: ANTAR domain-containing protein [Solirubrobacteraceae bacterium]|jgi:AmiR/NasT family two-component response regulator|nr:ANTAR domain-containing protein [Solirubrobacteraceae bacterium]